MKHNHTPPRLVFTISVIEDQFADLLGQAYERSCALKDVAMHTDYVKALTLCQVRSDNEDLSEDGIGHWFPSYASDWMCKNTRLIDNPYGVAVNDSKWENIHDREYRYPSWMVLNLIKDCLLDPRFKVEQKVITYTDADFDAWSDKFLELRGILEVSP